MTPTERARLVEEVQDWIERCRVEGRADAPFVAINTLCDDDAADRLAAAEALLREGDEEAWCDAVLGIAPHLVENKRAIKFRDHFYDWRRRVKAHFASHQPDGETHG